MKKIFIFLILILIPCLANTIVFGGSNLGILGYPSHDCYKPTKPFKPASFSSQRDINRYNEEVRRYNLEIEVYVNCMREYIENCQNDIERIHEKMQEAIDEVNSLL